MGRTTHRIRDDNGYSTRAYAITPDDTEVYVVLNVLDVGANCVWNIVMNVKDVSARFNAPDVSDNPLVNNLTFGGANPFSPLYWPLISPLTNRYDLIEMNAPGAVKPQVRILQNFFRYAKREARDTIVDTFPAFDASKLYFQNMNILPTQAGALPNNRLSRGVGEWLGPGNYDKIKSTYKFAVQIGDTTYDPDAEASVNYIGTVTSSSEYIVNLNIIGPASLPAVQLTTPTKVIIKDEAQHPFIVVEKEIGTGSEGIAYYLIIDIQEFPLGAGADFTFELEWDDYAQIQVLKDIHLYPSISLGNAPDGSPERQLYLFLESLWNNRQNIADYLRSTAITTGSPDLRLFNGYFIKVAYLHDYDEFFSNSTSSTGGGDGGSGGGSDTGGGENTGKGGASYSYGNTIGLRYDELFLNGNASDFISAQWKSDTHSYRVFTKFNRVLRHPWMPLDGSGMKVYSSTGHEVFYQMQKDVLVILGGEPPFAVYFNPNPDVTSRPLASYSSGEWSAVQHRGILFGYEPDNYKVVVKLGGYGETDPLLAGHRRDASAPLDATPYLQKISGQTIELIVPKNLSQQILRHTVYPVYLEYQDSSGVKFPMKYLYAVETSLEAYQDLLKVRINTVDPKDFFNVDIGSDRGAGFELTSELGLIEYLFRRSGMYGLLSAEPGVQFKGLDYWKAPPPDGPGLSEDEIIYRFTNVNLTSVIGEIETVLQANLCTSISRPDGGLHIVPLVPYADKPPISFANGDVPVLKYCLDAGGNYVNDPKLDIGELKVSLDGAFAAVEVEGYSNTVTANLVKTYATFVQGGQETTLLEIDAGLWENHAERFTQTWRTMMARSVVDDRLYYDPPEYVVAGVMDWNVQGARFSTIDGGIPKRKYYPEVWYRLIGLNSKDPSNLEVTTGDVNFHFVFEKYLFGLATEQLANSLGLDDSYNKLPAEQRNFDRRLILLGFRGYGAASNICGSLFGDPFFTLKLTVPDIDSATLVIRPLIGKPTDHFAPRWFPNFYSDYVKKNWAAYPRKMKRIENSFVGEMASPTYAVQAWWDQYSLWYRAPESLADHLATWLTFLEFLKTRSATIRYAGIAPWKDRQIIGIAVRPPDGSGPPRYMDFYMLDNVEFSYVVGGESWTSATGYYLFRLDLTTGNAIYDPQPDMGT